MIVLSESKNSQASEVAMVLLESKNSQASNVVMVLLKKKNSQAREEEVGFVDLCQQFLLHLRLDSGK